MGKKVSRRTCLTGLGALGVLGETDAVDATIGQTAIPRCTRTEFDFPIRTCPSGSTIRLGMIGVEGHIDMILGGAPVPGVRLVAWSNRTVQGDIAPGVKRYHEYPEMLEKEELDLVGICLPYYQNAGAAVAAAERGIHVIMEKPVSTTISDFRLLRETVIRRKIRLTALLGMRLEPRFRVIRDRIAAGDIGEPVLASAQKSYKFGPSRPAFYKVREQFGGTIPWVGIHAIDYMHYTMNLDYTGVAAMQGNHCHPDYPGVEDHAGLLFSLSNRGTAVLNLDYLRPETAPTHGDDRLRIIGSDGVIEIRDDGARVECITKTHGPRDLLLPEPISFFSDFISELRGERQHVISREDPFEMTRVALLARFSAENGVVVSL